MLALVLFTRKNIQGKNRPSKFFVSFLLQFFGKSSNVLPKNLLTMHKHELLNLRREALCLAVRFRVKVNPVFFYFLNRSFSKFFVEKIAHRKISFKAARLISVGFSKVCKIVIRQWPA